MSIFSRTRYAPLINRTLCSTLLLLFFTLSHAQAPLPDNLYDKFSPYYFGPNTFPIPDIHNGKVLNEIKVEIYNDTFFGQYYDRAYIPSIKLVFPLFSSRVNISAWMGVCDIYTLSPEKMAQLGFPAEEVPFSGVVTGDIYASTDIQVISKSLTSTFYLKYGIKNYPYLQYRLGVAYHFSLGK